MKIGIAVCTYNRSEVLINTLEKIFKHTKVNFSIMVFDDGSSDDTAQKIQSLNIDILSSSNRGIAWNKNRAIYTMKNILCCNVIILLEDDTFPIEDGWETSWVEASTLWGHINLAADHWPQGLYLRGDGTALTPYQSPHLSAQCEGFSAEAIEVVGYMDSRFRGYGLEHVEHSSRLVRAGYGGCAPEERWETLFYLIKSPLKIDLIYENESKHGNNNLNTEIFLNIKDDNIYRSPWYNDEERVVFLSEIRSINKNMYKNVFYIKNIFNQKLCFSAKTKEFLFRDQETIMNSDNLLNSFVYYNGKNAKFGYVEDEKYYLINEKFNDDYNGVEIILDKEKGFYFRYGKLFCSCNLDLDGKMLFNKHEAKDWEVFFVDYEKKVRLN